MHPYITSNQHPVDHRHKWFCKKFTNETDVVDMADAAPMCPGTITLSATGVAKMWPSYLGRYEATGEEQRGATIYRKSDGKYLCRNGDGTWYVCAMLGGYS